MTTALNNQVPNAALNADAGFLGVNMRLEPAIVPNGLVSAAKNMRFRNGVAATRQGIVKMPMQYQDWAFAWNDPTGVAYPFVYTTSPFDDVQGTGEFNDPNGERWILIATDGAVYRTKPNFAAIRIQVTTDDLFTVAETVTFIQCFNVVVMFRGPDHWPLVMTDFNAGFVDISQTATGTGTEEIPNSTHGVFSANRLFVPFDDDIAASDLNDYTRYEPQRQELRINWGSSDRLVAIYRWGEKSLACFKEQSTAVVTNLYGTMEDAELDELGRKYGCVARNSIADTGGDLLFLSQRGVDSLVQTAQSKTQGTSLPVSDPIQPLIDRINWRYADTAQAAYWNGCYYLALPIDGAAKNNAVLVYDTIMGAWAGYDQSDAIGDGTTTGLLKWFLFPYNGTLRLWFVGSDGFFNLYEEGFTDDVGDGNISWTSEPVEPDFTTRGYQVQNADMARFTSLSVNLATWNPNYSIEATADGGGESISIVTNVTKSASKSTKYNDGAVDLTNADSRHEDGYREDYSVAVDNASGFYFSPTANYAGVNLQRHQEFTERRSLRCRGKHVQVRFTNTQGRIEIRSVAVDGLPVAKSKGSYY